MDSEEADRLLPLPLGKDFSLDKDKFKRGTVVSGEGEARDEGCGCGWARGGTKLLTI